MIIYVVLNYCKLNMIEFFIICSYVFDEFVYNFDFFWLLIDVFCQLLEYFVFVGMNIKLFMLKIRKYKFIINENCCVIK